jgi:hypothetical protein
MNQANGKQLVQQAEALQLENERLRDERNALLRRLFGDKPTTEIRLEDYPLELASIEEFLNKVRSDKE